MGTQHSTLRRREMLLFLGYGAVLRAQDATFSTGTKVVSVLASVRDKQGHYVQDLTQGDFDLREDGRPQQVRYFSRQTDVPLTLGMLVDTSMSQRLVLDEERNTAREFFWQVVRPDKDSVFLIRFDVEVELTEDLTSSLTKLDKALDSLDIPTGNRRPGGRGGGGRRGQGGRGPAGGIGTLLYDAVFLASDEVLRTLPGRKAIILLSDGMDYGSKITLDRAIETTQKADTSVYAIHIFDQAGRGPSGPFSVGFPGGRGRGGSRRGPVGPLTEAGGKILRRMAEETGGRYFEVNGKKPLDAVFHEIEDELRNQYSLGYVSDRPAASGEFRKIELTVKRKGLTVQARNGYYAQP